MGAFHFSRAADWLSGSVSDANFGLWKALPNSILYRKLTALDLRHACEQGEKFRVVLGASQDLKQFLHRLHW